MATAGSDTWPRDLREGIAFIGLTTAFAGTRAIPLVVRVLKSRGLHMSRRPCGPETAGVAAGVPAAAATLSQATAMAFSRLKHPVVVGRINRWAARARDSPGWCKGPGGRGGQVTPCTALSWNCCGAYHGGKPVIML